VPDNRSYVMVSGTAGAVRRAFGASLRAYNRHGQTVRAPASALRLPSAVAGVVDGVAGLDESATMRPNYTAPPPPAFVNAPPCSRYWAQKIATDQPPAYGSSQPYVICGYTPPQFRQAYGMNAAANLGFNGRGQTIAIVDAYASGTIASDAQTYFNRHGTEPFGSGQFTQMIPTNVRAKNLCDPSGWVSEESIDIESSHGMAQGANVLYVGGRSCLDIDLAITVNRIVDHQLANVISNSYGDLGEAVPLSEVALEHAIYLQAAAEGISVLFSSGDSGDEVANTGIAQPDFPADDPAVTAVGGTSLALDANANYEWETGWGTASSALVSGVWTPTPPGSYLYGSGGGTSRVFAEPDYQRGVVPDSLATQNGGRGRVVPDISMDGDVQTGMLVGFTQLFPNGTARYQETRYGGTSLASPLFAGVVAIANQMAGGPLGFLNPVLYHRLAGTTAVHDVTLIPHPVAVVRVNYVNSIDASAGLAVFLRTTQIFGTLRLLPGYDDVTGIGSPNGLAFLRAIS
jgi:subtilase family serine protease